MREKEAISGIFMNAEGDKVLLFKRASWRTYSAGKFDLMGGDIHLDETPEETLRKEAKGKLNINVEHIEEKGAILTRATDVVIKRHCFVCREGDYKKLKIITTKYDQSGWYNKNEIKGLKLAPGGRSYFRNHQTL